MLLELNICAAAECLLWCTVVKLSFKSGDLCIACQGKTIVLVKFVVGELFLGVNFCQTRDIVDSQSRVCGEVRRKRELNRDGTYHRLGYTSMRFILRYPQYLYMVDGMFQYAE